MRPDWLSMKLPNSSRTSKRPELTQPVLVIRG